MSPSLALFVVPGHWPCLTLKTAMKVCGLQSFGLHVTSLSLQEPVPTIIACGGGHEHFGGWRNFYVCSSSLFLWRRVRLP